MKYSLMISAALLMAIGHTQSASAQQLNPIDQVKLAVEAQGGADALRNIKTLVLKGDQKSWEPGQSHSPNGEARFLGDSNVTVTVDFNAPLRVRYDWDRDMKYPTVDKLKYSEIRYPTYGAVIDDKGDNDVRNLTASMREGNLLLNAWNRRRALPRSKTRSSAARRCRQWRTPRDRTSSSSCSIAAPSFRSRCAPAMKTTSTATPTTTPS
jgi:hypothetical protein